MCQTNSAGAEELLGGGRLGEEVELGGWVGGEWAGQQAVRPHPRPCQEAVQP